MFEPPLKKGNDQLIFFFKLVEISHLKQCNLVITERVIILKDNSVCIYSLVLFCYDFGDL